MKAILRWAVTAAVGVATGIAGLGHAAPHPPSETALAITIHVRNYAEVASQTLKESEQAATAIFRKAGVEIGWEETSLPTDQVPATLAGVTALPMADIQLNILPDAYLGRSSLPANALGFAPGAGPGRDTIYVFDSKVRTVFWEMLDAHLRGTMDLAVTRSMILGHVIAHEVGHLLLNQQLHSMRGIMRGQWGFADLRNMALGLLLFTPQQAELMRADIRERHSGL